MGYSLFKKWVQCIQRLIGVGFIVFVLSGCGTSHNSVQGNRNTTGATTNTTNSANTAAPGEIRAEPIQDALKQVEYHIKVPSYLPFSVTSSYAIVTPEPSHSKVVQVTLYYINKDTKQVITEEVVNSPSAKVAGATTQKLSNGLNVTIDSEFHWHWTDHGITYDLSAAKKSSAARIITPNFSAKELENIVTSMN